jgi:NADH-quinone oxidoreductase subunit N
VDELTINTLSNVFRLAGPEVALVVASFIVFLAGAFRLGRATAGGIALLGFAAAMIALFVDRVDLTPLRPYVSTLWPDALALFTRVVAISGGALLLFAGWDELDDDTAPDYFACLLILTAGTGLVGAANELITLFLALELISIPTYVMLYLPRSGKPVQEAAVKYFLLSVFSSGLLLFGFSYLYGVTGTTNIPALHEAVVRGNVTTMLMIALVLVIAGLGFRITAVPFHFYAPDVYEGAANGPAALLAFMPKVAGFVALIRLLGFIGPGPIAGNALVLGPQLPLLLWILAVVTMTIGNILAAWQDDIKRLLAYSSIAHSGYLLMGLAAAPYLALRPEERSIAPLLFYLPAYGAMTIGAFAIIQALSTRDRPVQKLDDIVGLSGTHPVLALVMTLFLFSLIGLPLTAGFTGKFLLFVGVLSTPPTVPSWMFQVLAVIGAINAAIAAYYYLRIVGIMYLRTAIKPMAGQAAPAGILTLSACVAITIWLGCYPAKVVDFARLAGTPANPNGQLQAEFGTKPR